MNVQDRIKLKLKKILDKQGVMKFPQFLKGVRLAYGQSRRNVCTDLKFSEMRMFCLENGTFRRGVTEDEIETISKYYDIDSSIVRTKANSFIAQGLGKPQSNRARRQ